MAGMTTRAIICLATVALFCSSTPVCAEPETTAETVVKAEHPFFREELYPRWSEMTPAQLESDMKEAARRTQERQRQLEQVSPETANFDNTFGALSRATEEAEQLEMYVSHLHFTDSIYVEQVDAFERNVRTIRDARNQLLYSPRIQHTLNQWAKTPQAEALPPALRFIVTRQLETFSTPPDEQTAKQLNKLELELNRMLQQYAFNIRNVTNTWYFVFRDRKQLEGVPPGTIATMEEAARKRGFGTQEKPAWLFTLQMRTMADVLQYCRVEETRKKCWQGMKSPGNTISHDNAPIVLRIMQLRQEIAELKGFSCHADHVMQHSLMGSGQKALRFIDGILAQIQTHINELHVATLLNASQQIGSTVTQLNPWDIYYYSTSASDTLNKFSLQELRPYLEYEHTLMATFNYFGDLYGLTIREVPSICIQGNRTCPQGHAEVWHPDVRVFAVYDTATGKLCGSFYLDPFAREGRKYGTSTQLISRGSIPTAEREGFPPLVVLMLELHKPAPDKTQLLSHLELRMLFHELGHVFHLLLGNGEYKEQSATNVARDFIELPAQLQELRAWEPEVLCTIGRHYLTGEPMPAEIAHKAAASRHNSHYIVYLKQNLLIAKLDLEMHCHYNEKFRGNNLDLATANILAPYEIATTTVAPSVLRNFPHCIEGYDARYYAYILAEVMAADIHEEFKRHGLHNGATGRNYRRAILEPGNSHPAAELYRSFMGRDVCTDAFLHLLKN